MAAWELDRTVAAFERDRIVGVSRNYSFEITMPGGALVPAAGVSDVSVLPTHRRRGLLRTMMDRLLDDAVAHGEPVAMLTASEGGIYGRFGFGVTIRSCTVEVDTVATRVPRSRRPAGTLRIVRARRGPRRSSPRCSTAPGAVQPGAVSRFDPWWTRRAVPDGVRVPLRRRLRVTRRARGRLPDLRPPAAGGTAHGPASV